MAAKQAQVLRSEIYFNRETGIYDFSILFFLKNSFSYSNSLHVYEYGYTHTLNGYFCPFIYSLEVGARLLHIDAKTIGQITSILRCIKVH